LYIAEIDHEVSRYMIVPTICEGKFCSTWWCKVEWNTRVNISILLDYQVDINYICIYLSGYFLCS